jgi:hypothetical protein
MADQDGSMQKQTLNHANQEDAGTAGAGAAGNSGANIGGSAGSQHNDWGHSDAGGGASTQPEVQTELESNRQLNVQAHQQSEQQPGQQAAAGGNVGGVAGSQHNDWGHSPVATDDGQQPAGAGNSQSAESDAGQSPRKGVMPGTEMGHLQRGQDGGAQKG